MLEQKSLFKMDPWFYMYKEDLNYLMLTIIT